MIIQALLIIGVIFLVAVFFMRQSTYKLRAWSKISMILFVAIAIFVIAFPDSSNTVAHAVGVTRGADLLLYILTLSFVFVVLNLYLSRKRDQQRLVALARKVALLDAEIRQKSEADK